MAAGRRNRRAPGAYEIVCRWPPSAPQRFFHECRDALRPPGASPGYPRKPVPSYPKNLASHVDGGVAGDDQVKAADREYFLDQRLQLGNGQYTLLRLGLA